MVKERLYKDIKSKVVRILYYSSATKWGVLSVENTLENDIFFKDDTIILTGNFEGVYVGCEITYSGKFTTHVKYGGQIAIDHLKVDVDTISKESVINFLTKSHIKGISTQNARKIWDRFGNQAIDVVLNSPHELKDIYGIGEGTYEKVLQSVENYKRMEKLLKFCTDLGIPYNVIYKLDSVLGEDAVDIIKENIYQILDYSETLSFTQIDSIAMRMGIEPSDIRRARACMLFCIRNQIVMNSSTGCANAELKNDFTKKLGEINIQVYNSVLNQLIEEKILVAEGSNIYYKPYYDKEKFISFAISNLIKLPLDMSNFNYDTVIKAIHSFPFDLNDQQIKAIEGIVKTRVAVLTGGPGSGKSTITKALVDIFNDNNIPFELLSPTGKATRRMEECTGHPAQTIHKFLRVHTSLDEADPPAVAPNTVFIIDESSMVDISMLNKLLEISLTTPIRLVLVGDKDQLPSVQAGNVLADFIESGKVDTFVLTDIMRQAKDSHIIEYCSEINKGNIIKTCEHDDFVYLEYYDENDIYNDLLDLYKKEIDEHGLMEVQVICPYKKGTLGTINLNKGLSDYCNDNYVEEDFGFKINDKVMQVANDYDKGVFNGEVGITMGTTFEELIVEFQSGTTTNYYSDDLTNLILAYASTCHKSQGAEYKVVFVILDDSNGNFLLNRKLLYTAVSRGKKKVYILSKNNVLKTCVNNVYEKARITKLKSFLNESIDTKLTSSDEFAII